MPATVATLNGTTVELDDEALDELRHGFRGSVILPETHPKPMSDPRSTE